MRSLRLLLFAAIAFQLTVLMRAQDTGYWRATSKTARSITGDIALRDIKININFTNFTIAEIRALNEGEGSVLFDGAPRGGAGHIYRTLIGRDQKFLRKNTLCGADDTQWVVTYVTGKTLQLAFFSGNALPVLTPEAIATTTSLCGTYLFTR